MKLTFQIPKNDIETILQRVELAAIRWQQEVNAGNCNVDFSIWYQTIVRTQVIEIGMTLADAYQDHQDLTNEVEDLRIAWIDDDSAENEKLYLDAKHDLKIATKRLAEMKTR